ncbi:MAG: type I DNA topoisomerase [Patescibacteria group bacterium]
MKTETENTESEITAVVESPKPKPKTKAKVKPRTKPKAIKLIIVESPTKAKTISKFLGKGYDVQSSYGHVRDLPKSSLGIDTEKDFEPHYITPRKNQKVVTALKKLAAKSSGVILATDEDREGEAIAWHLVSALELEKKNIPSERIVFHEITETAIKDAISHPRTIDINMVDAQQARRILDRLVGYKLSPFLWKKVVRGLSAGRVQSVALRLIAEREDEIKAFKPQTYYTIAGVFETEKKESFEASLATVDEKEIEEPGITDKTIVERLMTDLKTAQFSVTSAENKELRKNPPPPFITSTLQQTAAQRLRFSAKKTMFLAQSLYEQGFITYMRTDSVNLSEDALKVASSWIGEKLGEAYLEGGPRRYKSKSRLAQEAHEAIRPTDARKEPGSLTLDKDQARLYDLIWKRFMSSQLPQAVFENRKVVIDGKEKNKSLATFSASSSQIKFDGFLKIWPTAFEASYLPLIEENDSLALKDIKNTEHLTEPPPRFTEASLIKTLEKHGIGRPSTYAPIISVIQVRNYVIKEKGHFVPTEIGTLANTVISTNFPEVVDIEFTAKMENHLDDVAEGKTDWRKIIKDFYEPFAKNLEVKYEEVSKTDFINETTDEVCEKCGKPMLIKFGRFGKFMACSGYPECKTTKTLPKDAPKPTGIKCEKCGEGELVERRVSKGRARGKLFWGCNRYPKCDNAVWENPLGEKKESTEPTEPEIPDNKNEETD